MFSPLTVADIHKYLNQSYPQDALVLRFTIQVSQRPTLDYEQQGNWYWTLKEIKEGI